MGFRGLGLGIEGFRDLGILGPEIWSVGRPDTTSERSHVELQFVCIVSLDWVGWVWGMMVLSSSGLFLKVFSLGLRPTVITRNAPKLNV